MAALTERTQGVEDKRRQLLEAAVRVFARKGYHASRVGDIAEEAGVAHGLLYHYFKSKDQVLEAVFHENWSVLQARIASVEETDEPAADQLAERIGELAQPIDVIQRVIARGIERGEFHKDIDPRVAATVVYGSIDELLTAWVLDRLPAGEDDVAAAEKTLIEITLNGLRQA